jgi:hypothetical protein
MFSLEQSFSTAQFELTAVLFNLTAITIRQGKDGVKSA